MAAGKSLSIGDERLLNFLIRAGHVPGTSRDDILAQSASEQRPLLEIVHRSRMANEGDIARSLAASLRLPLLNPTSMPVDDSVTKLVDEKTAMRLRAVPVRSDGDTLVLAMENPLDREAIQDIQFRTGRRVQPAVASRSQIGEAIGHFYRMNGSLRALLSELPDTQTVDVVQAASETTTSTEVKALEKEAEGAPIVKMVNLILAEAMTRKASDIHIEPGPNLVHVRYRIYGILEEALELPHWVQAAVTARIKVMAKLDITERRVPQDGRMRARFQKSVVDIRVSSLPTSYGEKIVMRLLDPSIGLRRLDELDFNEHDRSVIRAAIGRPEGMVLVTGPTGSGKSTTLYAMIQEVFSPGINIVTIENPVEYDIDGVAQVEVNERQGLTFAKALRSILRQDPDVILVGEIRDRETAEVAFHAAQTGHLVFSTLHTNDSVSTLTRLLNLGVETFHVASSLIMILAQRLVRTVCLKCATPLELSTAEVEALGIRNGSGLRYGKGCSACRNSGYAGRAGVWEVLDVTDPLRQLIETRASETALRVQARRDGMRTLGEDAVRKMENGITTPDEVRRTVQIATSGPACPQCSNPVEEVFLVCPFCQKTLRRTCDGCGRSLEPQWKSCPYCGLASEPAKPATETVTSAPPAEPPGPEAGAPPRTPAPPLEAAAEPEPEIVSPEERRKPEREIDVVRILVVDDNEDLRKIVRLALRKSSFHLEIEEAEDGEDALRKVAENRPHAIILDIMMPKMDGFEVCRRLRADLQTAMIPVLMLTARADAESRTEGFLAGTDDYIVKPFDRGELVARLHRLLQRTYGLVA